MHEKDLAKSKMNITIQPVTTIEECQLVNEIEMAAWDGTTCVPDHILITIAHQKGVVLLAYDDDLPVGFCISFVGFVGQDVTATNLRLKHHSHMAGVIPTHQGRGIGAMLKWAQREHVLRQQIGLMTWTFDPLETRNARLNIHKLGTVCCTYKRNVYGMMNDGINAGILSDRFQVDWWLDSGHVKQHRSGEYAHRSRAAREAEGVPLLNSAEIRHTHPIPISADTSLIDTHDKLLIAVPSDFQAVKRASLATGIKWRMHTRDLFEAAFANQFTVTDLIYEPQLSYYLLEKNWQS